MVVLVLQRFSVPQVIIDAEKNEGKISLIRVILKQARPILRSFASSSSPAQVKYRQ